MEPGFPNSHTTTTVSQSTTTVNPTIRFDPSYVRTIPGMLKCAEILLNILGFICISCTHARYTSRGAWFNTVAMAGFWFTGILLLFYLFHVIEKIHKIPWLKIEFVYCAIWTFMYLVAAALAADYGGYEAFAAAAFFGFVAMVVYGYDAWQNFESVRAGKIAQGDRVVNKSTTTSTVTSPGY